ncbi:MAG: alpha-galactosidase, partial [bacterium]
FRAATALFGHAGIEWDISELDSSELEKLRAWADLYKEKRSLIHSGESIRMDYPNEDHYLYGVVGKDEALFVFAALRPTTTSHSPNLRFRGLKSEAKYMVRA